MLKVVSNIRNELESQQKNNNDSLEKLHQIKAKIQLYSYKLIHLSYISYCFCL